jgi:AcrR family transcriptional regulator
MEQSTESQGYLDGRRSTRRAVTTADVLDAAKTLFAERGYHGTSLKQVAGMVEIRTPSLYNHMESKSALLRAIVMMTLNEVRRDFDDALAATHAPQDQLFEATRVYALRHATHRREALIVSHDTQHLPEPELVRAQEIRRGHERGFRRIITDGATRGQFSIESPKLASFAIREMCVSVARWFQDDGSFTPEVVAEQYARQALRMVGAGM